MQIEQRSLRGIFDSLRTPNRTLLKLRSQQSVRRSSLRHSESILLAPGVAEKGELELHELLQGACTRMGLGDGHRQVLSHIWFRRRGRISSLLVVDGLLSTFVSVSLIAHISYFLSARVANWMAATTPFHIE